MTRLKLAALLMPLLAAAPAAAQDASAVPETIVDDGGDNFTIGLGGSYVPSYEGSDDYVLTGAALVRGRVSGFTFYSRATALYFDVIREAPNAPINFELGPMVNVRFDRSGRIEDERVEALGELDLAIEPGGFIGLTKNGVFHDYDFFTVRLDVMHDVADTHDSTVFAPNIEYGTPLSTSFFIGASLSAEHVGGRYARTYYGVSPAGALASGLAPYTLDGGWKNWRGTLLGTYSLSGDLRRGAAIFAVGSYSRMLSDFRDSPIVADAGDADQYLAALGLSYTF
jgi:MipA family protein